MSLVDDLATAIVDAVDADISDFAPALEGAGRIEYVRDGNQKIPAGGKGRARVVANDPLVEDGSEYAESQLTNFGFDVVFDLAATNTPRSHLAAVQEGMLSTFSDGGAKLFAAFTDSGSNRLGGSGRVTIGAAQTEDGESPSRPKVTYTVEIRLWHKLPLT